MLGFRLNIAAPLSGACGSSSIAAPLAGACGTAILRASVCLLLLALPLASFCQSQNAPASGQLKELCLKQLGNVEVITASKEPEEVWDTPAAIYVLTQEDIRRSGATSIPEVLHLVPGVEVEQIDSGSWAVGIRGFGSGFRNRCWCLSKGGTSTRRFSPVSIGGCRI
jgi:iron complex outermembrane receptor protein